MRAEIVFQIHKDIPREGPGDSASTRRAFGFLRDCPATGRILDVGCGPGTQTIDLANTSHASIIAFDIHRPYLDELRARVSAAGLSNRVRAVRASMLNMPVLTGSVDAIWAEGSIYIIGWEKGLREWRPLLKTTGYLAATHLSWLASDVPDEPRRFWSQHYPAMRTVEENLGIARTCGYEPVEHFVLPESAWWDDYYRPLEQPLASLREQYRGDDEALSMIGSTQQQIDLYRQYADYYGYVFYVLRRN